KDESGYFDPDNGDSAGLVLTYGRFRTVNLGDLTWNGELDLMCPTNRIGTVDLYLTSHHGLAQSGSPALVHALQPRVAVMNNGTRKGGAADAFRVLHASPGLEDLWQLHWSHNVGLDNAPSTFVANIEDNEAIAGILTAPPVVRGGGPGPGRGGATAGPNAPAGVAGGAAVAGAGRPGGPSGPAQAGRGGPGGGAAAHTPAHVIKVSVDPDGAFTVTNTRTQFSKTYRRRP
ncbi:MAG: hypothetical protein IT183_10070, partial [Acidobacteria bacterium]|nr:hypothetical protein [Acidobacteriota bacterium]